MHSLTTEQRQHNKDEFIRILKSTRRKGLDTIISDLEKEGFFDASCHGHDRYPGGTLNHCLWVNKLAIETWKDLAKKYPDKDLPKEYNVKIVSLLHDVCDSGGFNHIRRKERGHDIHGLRSKLILERYKKDDGNTVLVGGELNAIKRHMHPKAFHRETVSTRNAEDWKTLLHYILKNSDGRSVEYYGDIPYDTPMRDIIHPVFNNDGTLYLPVRPGNHNDVCIQKIGDEGFTFSIATDGKSFTEVEELIGCKNLIIYIARFPEYRDSYVLACSGHDGLWRSYRIHKDGLTITPICTVGVESTDSARKLMKHEEKKQFYIRVLHTGCFESVDCLKTTETKG